ncbi:MAG: non-heme iron oxygenase ferredoxin subunit [Neisseriaceae bacterium]|nr:non-heme iron oxygenase ferredoxin subunit [Neisseriaceae bacterium]
MSWLPICKRQDISADMPKAVKVGEVEIGVFEVDGRYYGIEDVCPHAYALLSEGFVEGRTVECPLHEAIFDIPTGKLESGPGCRDLCTYPIKVEGDDVLVQMK